MDMGRAIDGIDAVHCHRRVSVSLSRRLASTNALPILVFTADMAVTPVIQHLDSVRMFIMLATLGTTLGRYLKCQFGGIIAMRGGRLVVTICSAPILEEITLPVP